MSKYHPVVDKIVEMLGSRGLWFETFEHAPVRTSEEAAKVRTGYTIHQGAKALILKTKTEAAGFTMFVLPGDLRIDNGKIRNLLNVKDIRFATPEEVSELTGGVQVGGVPPFGNLFGLKVFVDTQLLENAKIVFNAGDRGFSIGMLARDYQKLVNPQVADIS